MKNISLTKGKCAIVDNEDFDYVNQWKWHCLGGNYAARREGRRDNYKYIYMHRLLSSAKEKEIIDHKNGNSLDNRKRNLRVCDQSINTFNSRLRKDNKSGIRGVSWDESRKKWFCRIKKGDESFSGRFDSKEECAKVYREKAKKFYGFLPYKYI